MSALSKIPVTILTGFLGSGKTTLLNRILREQHGRRIAVIENEYGEVGIDHALVINADEEVFEMSNGCICCTVRGDLIRILGSLMKRREKFDYVLVETTGLADPGPVAQTFFMDDDIREAFALDGIVTVVDTKHIEQQLGRSSECDEQVAFADVILLNKIDLVEPPALDRIEGRVRTMNRLARVHRTQRGELPIDAVLGLGAFDLDRTLIQRPSFLEPEYPFEWTGVYEVAPGRHRLFLDVGPDPSMSLVVIDDAPVDAQGLERAAEQCLRQFAEEPHVCPPGSALPVGRLVELDLHQGASSFELEVQRPGRMGLFAQHLAEEFNLRLVRDESGTLIPLDTVQTRAWVAQHEHDDEVGSVALEIPGDVDGEKLNAWLSELLRTRGADLFRIKGFISIAGESRRYLVQGVHMLVDGQPERPWGDAPRMTQLVLIGRDLDAATLRRGFEACLQ